MSDPWLILNGVKDFSDRELQWSEALHQSVASSELGGWLESAYFL